MSFVAHIAIVSETTSVSLSELTRVSAALQKQVARDLGRLWNVDGTVDAFASLDDVPPGYWPVVVRDDIGLDASGIHCDPDGQPMALIASDVEWSLNASHEVLEMLVDPFGNRMIASTSVAPNGGRVEYLVEVADPVSDKSYSVNGVKVSDFYTPQYFDPVVSSGVQYSLMGNLTHPRQILEGGYLTWFEPVSGQWFQQSWFSGDSPIIASLGSIKKSSCGMRPSIDRLTRKRRKKFRVVDKKPQTESIDHAWAGVLASSKAKAERWRTYIHKIVSKSS